MRSIAKPDMGEYPLYYETYISKVPSGDLVFLLEEGLAHFLSFIPTIPADKLDYRYQEGKWTIREIIVHLMDAERIFVYRAMRFSRADKTHLPGFDENEFVPNSGASERSLESLLREYTALRESTIEFFRHLRHDMTLRSGISNGGEISVRALGYIIPGHEAHHLGVIRDRYLMP